MRTLRGLLVALSTTAAGMALVGCADAPWGRDGQSGIVFGISQSTDSATGKPVTRVGYEYLELAARGGWMTEIRAEDDRCVVEDLAHRLGASHVGDGGEARFHGGGLPPEGLLVVANESERSYDLAWALGSAVWFEVTHGFAIPDIEKVRVDPPATALEIASPAPGALALDVATDLSVAWSFPQRPAVRSNVVFAFETESSAGRGKEVRCFYEDDLGAAVLPAAVLRTLGEAGTRGKLRIATQRQVAVIAPDGWIVYVVGAVFHREQAFITR